MLIGIVLGLLTALFHSLTYLATRWYTADRGWPTRQLLVHAHLIMGALAWAALPLLWPDGLRFEARWVVPYVLLITLFVIAQACLITALERVEASRVAPLLGLKVAMLAVIASVAGQDLALLQWLAVVLAVISAWVLNGVGGRLPWQATTLMLVACASYAACDTCILHVMNQVKAITGDRSVTGVSNWTVAAVYSGVSLVALALLPVYGCRKPAAWRDALPYAGCWLSAMVTLYATFAAVGTVLGAILQSTRGLISIGLGVTLAAMGWHHLEQKHGRSVVVRRLGAALLMTLAVVLYVTSGVSGDADEVEPAVAEAEGGVAVGAAEGPTAGSRGLRDGG